MIYFVEFALVFYLGVYLLSGPIKMWRKVGKISKLPLVDAVILENEIIELREPMAGNDDKAYQPKITFSAYVNGRKITSQALCPDEYAYMYLNRMHAIASANSYPVNSLVQARLVSSSGDVEPELMLTAEIDWRRQSHYVAWAIFAILICMVALGLAWIRFSVG